MISMTCERCERQPLATDPDIDEWNATVKQGVIVALLCPACQTAEENAEAVINQAMLEYGTDAFGRVVGRAKR